MGSELTDGISVAWPRVGKTTLVAANIRPLLYSFRSWTNNDVLWREAPH